MKITIRFFLFIISFSLNAQLTAPIATIPFELDGNHLFIELEVSDSKKLNFIFDTGAGSTIMNTRTTRELGFDSDKKTIDTGAAGRVETTIIKNKSFTVHDLKLDKIDVRSSSLDHLEKSIGRNIDGIIGYDLLKKYVIKIDYNTSQLIIYKSNGFKYSGNGSLIKINLGKIPTAIFQISLDANRYLNSEFIIDNGAGLSAAFATPFAKKNQLKRYTGKTYTNSFKGFSTNTAETITGRLYALKIIDSEFKNIPVTIYNTKVGVFAIKDIAGVIGNEILKRFNITFDYKRKKSYWETNDLFATEPFEVSHSGIKLKLSSDKSKKIVDYIIPESPAAVANLAIGDEILEIDGVKASDASLKILRNLLRQNGKKVKLIFERNHQIKEITLLLKPLI